MAVLNNPAAFSLSGAVASGAGTMADCRHCANYGLIQYVTPANSARVALQASVDGAGWVDVAIYTATTTTAQAQVAGYYPFVRATVMNRYGDSSAYVYWAPGLT